MISVKFKGVLGNFEVHFKGVLEGAKGVSRRFMGFHRDYQGFQGLLGALQEVVSEFLKVSESFPEGVKDV